MGQEAPADPTKYRVVANDDEQYSLWLYDRPIPQGWRDVGMAGSRRECLDYIGRTWVDMRPRSLREATKRR